MMEVSFSSRREIEESEWRLAEGNYRTGWSASEDPGFYLAAENSGRQLFIEVEEIIKELTDRGSGADPITLEEATFTASDNGLRLTVVLNFIDIIREDGDRHYDGEAYLFIEIDE